MGGIQHHEDSFWPYFLRLQQQKAMDFKGIRDWTQGKGELLLPQGVLKRRSSTPRTEDPMTKGYRRRLFLWRPKDGLHKSWNTNDLVMVKPENSRMRIGALGDNDELSISVQFLPLTKVDQLFMEGRLRRPWIHTQNSQKEHTLKGSENQIGHHRQPGGKKAEIPETKIRKQIRAQGGNGIAFTLSRPRIQLQKNGLQSPIPRSLDGVIAIRIPPFHSFSRSRSRLTSPEQISRLEFLGVEVLHAMKLKQR